MRRSNPTIDKLFIKAFFREKPLPVSALRQFTPDYRGT